MHKKEMLHVHAYQVKNPERHANVNDNIEWKTFTFQFDDIKDVLACIEVLKICKTYNDYVVNNFEYEQIITFE